jgi:nucleoid-associated protein YgaU
MTSDAKIGLLLGLIFIFVIAFIINGLPNLRPQTTKAEVVTNAMRGQDENLGLADREQKARETMSWADLLDTQEQESAAPVAAELPNPMTAQPMAANPSTEEVHPMLPLPGSDSLERFTKGLENIVRDLAEASGQTAAREKTEPAPIVEMAKSERTQEAEAPARVNTAAPVALKAGRTYVVQEGENLASVAKKVYGPEEGNRIVNIQRIFEANRDILPSADKVLAGQELLIPPPAKPVEKKPADVLPGDLFQKVQQIGRSRVTAQDKQSEKSAAGERWYVVQQDDSLWKIAATQLGSGARYKEIMKLNADVLKDDEFVNVGTRLRLPAK